MLLFLWTNLDVYKKCQVETSDEFINKHLDLHLFCSLLYA